LRAGEAQKALEECDLGLERQPNDAALHILRGKALFELERYDPAAAAYRQALEVGKDLEDKALGEARLGLAMVALRKQDYREAKTHFAQLVSDGPRDADARINLARVCLQL